MAPEELDDEARLREHNRQIANRMAVRGMWHEGTCKGCGLADLPVIGVPGSEYCRYCEELRTLVPVPDLLAGPQRVRAGRAVAGLVLVMVSCIIASLSAGVLVPAALLIFGILLIRSA